MRRPKVDLSGCQAIALAVAPKVDRSTGEVQTERETGRTKYTVDTYLHDPATGDAGMVRVVVPAAQEPTITVGGPVQFEDLRCMHWEAGTRSGMSWSASAVAPVGARRGGASE